MNSLNKIRTLKILRLIALTVLFIGGTYSPPSFSSDSNFIGPGGGTSFTRSCKKTQRISGIGVSISGEGIQKVRVRCTTYSRNGRWANSQHSFTSWTNYSSNITNIGRIGSSDFFRACPVHRWVGAIEGRSAFLQDFRKNSLLSIKYKCFPGDENGTRSGEASEVSPTVMRGGNVTTASCPQNEIAYAISGTIFEGRIVTSLKLKCMIAQVIPTATPTPLSPGSFTTQSISAGWRQFRFHSVSNATHYRVRILTDSRSPRSWFDQMFGGRLLFPYPSSVDTSYVKIVIPNNKVGTVAKWKVQACNKDRQCGPWSEWKRFSITSGR